MAGATDQNIANMDAQIALPRKNGELVFEAPWEARAFGLAVALNERGVYPWRDFSEGLAAETKLSEQTGGASSYYERWLASLEELVIAKGLVAREELDARAIEQALHERHEHDHEHGHSHEHDHEHLH